MNQDENQPIILNYEDEILRELRQNLKIKLFGLAAKTN